MVDSGEELFQLLKQLKTSPLFKNSSSSDLIPLAISMERIKFSSSYCILDKNQSIQVDAVMVLKGDVVLEVAGDFNPKILNSGLFMDNENNTIKKIIIQQNAIAYKVPRNELQKLLAISTEVMNQFVDKTTAVTDEENSVA